MICVVLSVKKALTETEVVELQVLWFTTWFTNDVDDYDKDDNAKVVNIIVIYHSDVLNIFCFSSVMI